MDILLVFGFIAAVIGGLESMVGAVAVAINPAELSEGEFLAPYANENQLSVNSEQLSVMRQLTVASSQQNLDFVSNTDY
jgi:branched-subunit amino acid ABC-type transport system permease component